MNEQLSFERPETPRFPMRGIPLAEMMEAVMAEGGTGRLVR